jgi:hypothetical protein
MSVKVNDGMYRESVHRVMYADMKQQLLEQRAQIDTMQALQLQVGGGGFRAEKVDEFRAPRCSNCYNIPMLHDRPLWSSWLHIIQILTPNMITIQETRNTLLG